MINKRPNPLPPSSNGMGENKLVVTTIAGSLLFIAGAFLLLVHFTPAISSAVQVSEINLKFHAGQKVHVTSGFFKGCNGIVTGFYPYRGANDPVKYKVDMICGLGKAEELVLETQLIGEDTQ